MKTKFTPGPWQIELNHSKTVIGVSAPKSAFDDCDFICDFRHRDIHASNCANAALIAAAPELYAALWHFAYPGEYTGQPARNEMIAIARAALAKARGEE